jgi:hypothetical protein
VRSKESSGTVRSISVCLGGLVAWQVLVLCYVLVVGEGLRLNDANGVDHMHTYFTDLPCSRAIFNWFASELSFRSRWRSCIPIRATGIPPQLTWA